MMGIRGFFGGRVDLRAEGNQTERFMELLHRQNIPISAPRREAEGGLRFSMPARQFKRLRDPAFKTATKVRILKKRGLFIALRPYRYRYGLAVGVLLFLGLIYYCSCFIWQIEVVGCEDTSQTQILAELEELGLKRGCRRTIDVEKIENLYLRGNDRISWLSINIRGTVASVEVREQGIIPEVVDLSTPSNIYAARDGVILSIRDYGGTRCVSAGEAVAAGDLLVSGERVDSYGVVHYTRSIATVIAATTRETEIRIPLVEKVEQKTGKSTKKYAISLGNWKIPLYFNKKIEYNKYDTMEKVYPLRIGSFAFPLRLEMLQAEETETVTLKYTPEEAEAKARSRLAFYQADHLAECVVQERKIEQIPSENAYVLRATFYCEEEIGLEMPIEN